MINEPQDYYMNTEQLTLFGRDDITYCGNKCSRTDCYRNQCHLKSGDIFSMSMFNCTKLDEQVVVVLD